MAELVYAACAATSLTCAWLLIRSYRESRVRLLFWSSLCFAGLALNNILLFVDLVIIREAADLLLLRTLVAVVALSMLLFGLIWETP